MPRQLERAPTAAPRWNSVEWIGRFVARLVTMRPDVPVPLATGLAVKECAECRDVSPERAAMSVAERDF